MLLQGLQEFHNLLTLVISLVLMALGLVLVGIALPKENIWNKVRLVRRYMATSYFVLSVSGLIICFFERPVDVQPLFLVSTLFVAAAQILFFTCILLVIVDSPTLTKTWVFNHISITAVLGIVLTALCVQTRFDVKLEVYVFALSAYVLQNLYYIHVYRRDLTLFVVRQEGDLKKHQKIHLRWGRSSFYGLLLAAGMVVVASVMGGVFYLVCVIIGVSLYIYLVVRFYNDLFWGSLNYDVNDFSVAVADPAAMEEAKVQKNVKFSKESDQEMPEEDKIFRNRLKQWIAIKGYLDKDLSVDDMAVALSVDRNYLRYYFRTYMKTEFRTWRSELRIGEALKLMENHPEYALSKVAELVGYNHRSNFFKQFENITGIPPSIYKESCEKRKAEKAK